jgi:hypothetical protein
MSIPALTLGMILGYGAIVAFASDGRSGNHGRIEPVPQAAKLVVSTVAILAVPELMMLPEIAGHLERRKVSATKSIDVIYSSPYKTHLIGPPSLKEIDQSPFQTSDDDSVYVPRRNTLRRPYCRIITERKNQFDGRINLKLSFKPDHRRICRGLPEILEDDVDSPRHIISTRNVGPGKFSVLYHQISSQLTLRRASPIAYLPEDDQNKQERRDREGVVQRFASKSTNSPIPVLIGVICGAIGIAINLKSRSSFGALIGAVLVVLGILTPALLVM